MIIRKCVCERDRARTHTLTALILRKHVKHAQTHVHVSTSAKDQARAHNHAIWTGNKRAQLQACLKKKERKIERKKNTLQERNFIL